MKHNPTHSLCVGWMNLTKDSRDEVREIAAKIQGAINASVSEDPATADALLEFNLSLIGMEIVEAGLGYEPRIGDIICPRALDRDSWNYPAYIVPMNL